MNVTSAHMKLYAEKNSLLAGLIKRNPKLNPPYIKIRDKIIELNGLYERRLNELAVKVAGRESENPILRLSILLDEENPQAKEALVEYYKSLFGDLNFLAKEVACAIQNKDVRACEQLAGLLSSDCGVLEDPIWGLVSYVNVIPKDVLNTGNEFMQILSQNISDPGNALSEVKKIESKIIEGYTTETQQQIIDFFAVKRVLENMK